MTSSAALTAAKAAASATAADLEAIAHRLETATAAHAETAAELSAILAADAAGEAEAVAHDVAVLRSELDLRASRLEALKASHAKAIDTNAQANFRLRAEHLKASTETLSATAVDALVEAAQQDVQDTLRKLAERLQKGAERNLEALEEARQLNAEGAAGVNGLSITGDISNQVLVIDGKQFVTFVNIPFRLETLARNGVAAIADELAAPRTAERAARFAADAARDAKYKADLRDLRARNNTRVDMSAL